MDDATAAAPVSPDRKQAIWTFEAGIETEPATTELPSLEQHRAQRALPFAAYVQFDNVDYGAAAAAAGKREPLPPVTLDELVAYITNNRILDYTAMSDFFLTFRMFTDAMRLLELLFTRLAWAIDRTVDVQDAVAGSEEPETGRDVALRTFVVLRHWILNFFADDFLPDLQLRQCFAYSLNRLYVLPMVNQNPFFRKIFGQLKRCWISELAVYWDLGDEFVAQAMADLDQQVFAGGAYGTTSLTASPDDRRQMLLNLYKGFIAPMDTQVDTSQLGGLIRGGIRLNPNVEVAFVEGPEIEDKPTPRPTIQRRLLHKLRFDSSRRKRAGKPKLRLRSSPSTIKLELHDKIDLLALRAIDQLNALLDIRQQFANAESSRLQLMAGPQDSGSTNYEEYAATESSAGGAVALPRTAASYLFDPIPAGLTSHASLSTLKDAQHEGAPDLHDDNLPRNETLDTLDIQQPPLVSMSQDSDLNVDNAYGGPNNDDSIFKGRGVYGAPLFGSEASAQSSPRLDEDFFGSSRESFVSTYSAKVNLRRSAAPQFTGSGMLDALGIENVSYHGSMSTLSTLSRASFMSASSVVGTSNQSSRLPRSQGQHHLGAEHREQEVYMNAIPHDMAQDMDVRADKWASSQVDTGSHISLLSELTSGYEMAPCEGYNSQVAAELAAIPDESYDGDALAFAVQKLEGTYIGKARRSSIATSIRSDRSAGEFPSFMSGDSRLYSQAFASKTNFQQFLNRVSVSSLAIPENSPGSCAGADSTLRNGARGDQQAEAWRLKDEDALPFTVQANVRSVERSKEHAPFVLSVAPHELAAQFTIIERDALQQVDWRELIEMKWSNSQEPIDSWLWFLAERNVRGVGVVTARFNLVVNWVKSEILLCRQASLKAQTITRFIHVACACFEMQNYATLFQIMLALTSDIVANHQATAWSLVNKLDVERLEKMEQLVTPLRNFSRLRAAHNRINFSRGCIPFAGLYLADLTYNHQKPNWDGGRVNFSKFQTAASIVRSLMQCVEWTKNYKLTANPALLSKCLYLQSLTAMEMDQLLPTISEH